MTTARRPVEGTLAAQVITILALGGVVTVLHALGRGPLASPGLDPDAMRSWLDQRQPAEVGLALLRLGSLVVGWHLLAVLTIALAARLIHRPGAVTFLVDRCTLPPLRRLVRHLAGLSMAASTLVTSPLPVGAQPDPAATAVMVAVPSPESEGTGASTHRPAPAGVSDPGARPSDDVESHVVRPGDHLWGIARAHLVDRLGEEPSGPDLEAHWRRLIEANPEVPNPDLIFIGEVIRLPSPEVARRSTVASPRPTHQEPNRADGEATAEATTGPETEGEAGRATMRVKPS